ncbi:MAG: CocE/NonD family hydrolase [Actinobacteria bacterium]|nr:CocE/NonD family hydrolase [Actinomycetota bacterium]
MAEMIVEQDLLVPMRDGVRIAADIYRPAGDGPFPVLVAISPYGKGKQSIQTLPQPPGSPIWDGGVEAGDPRFLTANGYVHVIADCRGVNKSEGEYRGWMSKQEGEDGYDLIEWIAAQPWCDGNVGMVGISYFGTIQLHVAAEQPPALKAIMPWNAVADFYREATHHGGTIQTFFFDLYTRSTNGNPVSVTPEECTPDELVERMEALKADPDLRMYTHLWHLIDNPNVNPSFFDVLLHPFDGPFYWERSAYTRYADIKIPYYTRSAWWAYAHMHLTGTFRHLAGINAPAKLEIDRPVDEERPLARSYDEEAVRWYDYWLKGIDTGVMDEPPLRLFVMGSNTWRREHEWPLARTEWKTLHLRPWGGLTEESEPLPESSDEFLQQPLSQTLKIESLDYATLPLPQDTEVIGPIALRLFASIDAKDTNWIVALEDVDPAGNAREVTRGYLKASHREVDREQSKPWEPYHPHLSAEPVTPGEVVEYEIAISPTANLFRRGNRIRLRVMSMDYRGNPRPAPGVSVVHYPWHVCSSETVRHTVYHDASRPSSLLLPIIPAGS